MTEPGQAGRIITSLYITELTFHDRHQWRDNGVADAEYDQVLGGTDDSIPHDSLLDLFAHGFIDLRQNSDTKHVCRLTVAAREGKSSADLFACVAHGLHESLLPIESMKHDSAPGRPTVGRGPFPFGLQPFHCQRFIRLL